MTIIRFLAGRAVEFKPTSARRNFGPYEVIRELPWEGGELKYRLKSSIDGHERVAEQHELRAISTTEPESVALGKRSKR